MNKMLFILLFSLSIILGAFFRLYRLNDIPPGINRDEASIGYTAYSLLKTGSDEYGRYLPVSFQSFGDWKLPVYIYETVLSVKIFGLSPFAVRIPSALAGIFLIPMVYLLMKVLFRDKVLALASMLVYAVSPWSIHLSRVESESNTAVFFVATGVLLFLLSLNKRSWLIIPSAILLALSYGTYAGNYIFTTLLALGLFFIYRIKIFPYRIGKIAILIFFLMSILIWYRTTGANIIKISGTGIFGDPAVVNAEIEIPRNEHVQKNGVLSQFIHNKGVYALQKFLHNYVNAFSPDFLFIRGGGNHAHNIQKFGNMYLIEAPFLLLGLVFLLRRKKGRSEYLVLWWLMIAPIAASITKDAPHTNRMFAIFPMLPIVTALGIVSVFRAFHSVAFKTGMCLAIIMLYGLNIIVYLDRYYVHFPFEESQYWGIVYQRLNTLLSEDRYKNKKIIMEGQGESPYIFFLFYTSYDPARFQKDVVRYPTTPEGFVHVKSFDKYEFQSIDWEKYKDSDDLILIARPENIPPHIKSLSSNRYINLPSGDPIFAVLETPYRNASSMIAN